MRKIIIDYEDIDIDEDIMDGNSLVMSPAHQNNAKFFNKHQLLSFSDDEKRMVLGVVIEADKEIYRNANEFIKEPHTVNFTAPTVEKIRNSFHKSDKLKNISFDHDGVNVEDLILVQSYIVGGKENPKLPDIFEGQKVNDGSWIIGYHVPNKEVWKKVKSKGFGGFSVEVSPYLNVHNFNNQKQSKMKKPNFWGSFFGTQAKGKFEAVTADGQDVTYDGELAIGTVLSVTDADGNVAPLASANTVITADGKDYAVETGEDGAITAISDVEAAPAETTDAVLADFAVEVRKQLQFRDDNHKRLEASLNGIADQLKEFKAEFSELKKKSNFKSQSTPDKRTAIDLLKD